MCCAGELRCCRSRAYLAQRQARGQFWLFYVMPLLPASAFWLPPEVVRGCPRDFGLCFYTSDPHDPPMPPKCPLYERVNQG